MQTLTCRFMYCLCLWLATTVTVYAEQADNNRNLEASKDDRAMENWAYSIGLQAYVFGLPVVVFNREAALRLNSKKIAKVKDICPCAMMNSIGHKYTLATSSDVMPYTPNNDTVYSGALVEYRDEPVILTVPDIDDRYWSVQVANPYTENKFYIGTRATGGKGGHHAFVAPDWKGTLPDNVTAHRMDYDSAMLAVRIAVVPQDEQDLKAVHALQNQFALTSLSNFGNEKTFGQGNIRKGLIAVKEYAGELGFFQKMADLLAVYPPVEMHQAMVNSFKLIGLVPGEAFNPDSLSPAMRRGLVRALKDGPEVMQWKVKYRGTPYATRWNNLRAGTYNYDYFDRAAGALEGLFVHDRDEAVYFSTYESGDGAYLDANANYVLHFDKDELPPTDDNGFWSLTMYGRDFQLVDNEINRYSIGDRTPGMEFNQDGSLDIYIQSEAPEGKESNWLPAPKSGLLDRIFRVNYRVYLPKEQTRNPSTLEEFLPPIEKQ